jgi:hypothetical protein
MVFFEEGSEIRGGSEGAGATIESALYCVPFGTGAISTVPFSKEI